MFLRDGVELFARERVNIGVGEGNGIVGVGGVVEKRQAAEEKRRRTEQAELDRMLAEEDALLAAADSGALAEYVALIRQKVERNWVRPPGAAAGLECELHVTQIPGGQVTGVRIGNCPADEAVRRSIEAAVLRASLLPMPANQALFERNLRFVFKPEE